MRLLKNKAAWRRWSKNPGLKLQLSSPREPAEYPCFVYTTLRSFRNERNEELDENYLYRITLKEMLTELRDP